MLGLHVVITVRKILRMRTTENCVFLCVRVTCYYYGVKEITLRMRIFLFLCDMVTSGYYGAKVFLVLCVRTTEWEQICGNNISLFGKGIR